MGTLDTGLVLLVMAVSALIQSSLGIGFAMFAAAALSFFVDPVTSAALVSVAVTALGIDLSLRMRKSIRYRIAVPPLISMMCGKIAGVVTLMHVDGDTVRWGLGVTLILFSAYFCFLSGKVKIRPSPAKGFVLGLLAGFLGGIYNLTGPFAAIYFYSATEDKYEYSASMNFAFLPSAVVGLIAHIAYGNLYRGMLPVYVLSCAAVVVGVGVGLRLLAGINRKQLSTCLYIFMAVMGCVILLQ